MFLFSIYLPVKLRFTTTTLSPFPLNIVYTILPPYAVKTDIICISDSPAVSWKYSMAENTGENNCRILVRGFRKIVKRLLASSCLSSVSPHGKTRLLLAGFSLNSIFQYFLKNLSKNIQVLLKAEKINKHVTVICTYIHVPLCKYLAKLFL
jgi:hypothetical protein